MTSRKDHRLFAFAFGLLAALLLAGCASRTELIISRKGRSDYRIIVPKGGNPAVLYAAGELQRYFRDVSGGTLEIVAEDQAGRGPAFLLGRTRRAEKAGLFEQAGTLKNDGVLIKTIGRDVALLGEGDRGQLYSVYTFLERYAGCRFLAYDCTVAPLREVVRIPRVIDYRYSPPFLYREILAYDAGRWGLIARQRLNGGNMKQVLAPLPPDSDERIPGIFLYPFVHTFAAIVPKDKYFANHPEYFSLVKGKRCPDTISGQLCLTNPEVLELAKAKALEWIGQHPELMSVDISQNDTWPDKSGACECEKCAAIVREEGSQHGPILRFVNEIADAVKAKYPDKFVDTLAYAYTIVPPKITKPRPNVIIRLCHYGCYFHGIEGEDMSKDFRTAVEEWPKVSTHVFIWHYGTNFWHYLAPNPNLESLVKDFRYYAAHGIDGLMLQGNIQSPGGELAELRQYLASQLMWDPSLDPMAIRTDFCNGYYGEAAGETLEYLALMDKLKDTNGKHYPMNGWEPPEVATPEFVASGLAILDRGLAKTADPVRRGRVEKLMVPLWYMRLGWPDRYGLSTDQGRELLARFKKTVQAFKITNESEGPIGNMDGFLKEMDARYGE
jgi:hypothetical protein